MKVKTVIVTITIGNVTHTKTVITEKNSIFDRWKTRAKTSKLEKPFQLDEIPPDPNFRPIQKETSK